MMNFNRQIFLSSKWRRRLFSIRKQRILIVGKNLLVIKSLILVCNFKLFENKMHFFLYLLIFQILKYFIYVQ